MTGGSHAPAQTAVLTPQAGPTFVLTSREPSADGVQAQAAARAQELFNEEYERLARRTDKMLQLLLLVQWPGAIALAYWLSPSTWAGRAPSPHIHVYAALIVGGLLTIVPIAVSRAFPGKRIARVTLACALMLWSALLIHLTGGRIETHFHIFGCLAFLAFYRDMAILAPATVIVALDHFLRGMLWPESMYGEANPGWWRFLEHAGWVLFIDIFLVYNCRQSYNELRALTDRQAQLELQESFLEERVLRRTEALTDERRKVTALNDELRSRMHRFRALFTQSPIGIVVLDDAARFIEWNDAFQRILERCDANPFASDLVDFVEDEDRDRFQAMFPTANQGASEEETCSHDPVEIRFGRGSKRAVTECVVVPAAGNDGAKPEYFALVRDVTDQREAEADNEAMRAQMTHTQKLESIGQLAAGIAHEINTPTQYITDNVGFLKKALSGILEALDACVVAVEAAKADSLLESHLKEASKKVRKAKLGFVREEVPKAIDQSLDGLARVTKIVRAMKEFSHPSQGTKALTDINSAIEATLTVARNEWKYVAKLETQLDPTLPRVPCMRDEFNQVILNIIVNAAHAIGDANKDNEANLGTIAVSTSSDDNYAIIEIADSGTGMPESVRRRIFEPFFTTKEVGRGTGQGLAIAYSVVVDKHQGAIDVRSEPGRGTTFTIRLPLSTEEEIEAA